MNEMNFAQRLNMVRTVSNAPNTSRYGVGRRGLFSALFPATMLLLIVVGPWLIRLWFDVRLLSTIWTMALALTGVVFFVSARLTITKLERNFLVYSLVLALVLSFVSMWSIDPAYSIPRAIISSLFLGIALVLGSRISAYMLNARDSFFNIVNYGLIAFLFFLLVGYFFIPDFSSGAGSLRLSGGINPNTVGMYCLYVIIWTILTRAIFGCNLFSNNILIALTFIVLLLSFSRASWLAVLIFFITIFLLGSKLKTINNILKYLLPITIIGGVYFLIKGIPDFLSVYLSYFDRRVFMAIDIDSNFQSRASAWSLLMAEFYRSPLVGYFGWYNSTNFLSASVIAGEATSPHGLYVRLLSEVGLFGTITILALPLSAIFVGTVSILRNHRSKDPLKKRQRQIYSICVSGLIAIFVGRELFEDSYLGGYIGLTTLVVAFLVSLAFSVRIWETALLRTSEKGIRR